MPHAQVAVLAAKTNARASTAHGPGLRTSIAGTPAAFSIVAADEYGNQRAVCGDVADQRLNQGPPPLCVGRSGPAAEPVAWPAMADQRPTHVLSPA